MLTELHQFHQSLCLVLTFKGSRIFFCGNSFTPPLLVTPRIFPTIGIKASWCLQRRFQGPKLKIKMSYRREIPKLNRDNFNAWNALLKLHLALISDLGLKYFNAKYVAPTRTMTIEEIVE